MTSTMRPRVSTGSTSHLLLVALAFIFASCDAEVAPSLVENGPFGVELVAVARTSESSQGAGILRLSRVEVCGSAGCNVVGEGVSFDVVDAQDDVGVSLSNVGLYVGDVTRISFSVDDGSDYGISNATIDLPTPISAPDSGRALVYVAFDPVAEDELSARLITSGDAPIDYDASMVVVPSRGGTYESESGFSYAAAPSQNSGPAVYTFKEYDVGKAASYFNVYSSLFASGLTAEMRIPLDPFKFPPGIAPNDYIVRVDGEEVGYVAEGGELVVRTGRTGFVSVTSSVPFAETDSGELIVGGDDQSARTGLSGSCAENLAAKFRTYFDKLATGTYALRATDCVNTDPGFHVVLVNLSASRARILLPRSDAGGGFFNLKKLTTLASSANALAAINGYFWVSGDGKTAGQKSKLDGTVVASGRGLSAYSATKEALFSFSSRVNGSIRAKVFFKTSGSTSTNQSFQGRTYNDFVVGSRSSIMANGSCTQDRGGTDKAASAIGYGGGVLMMVSTVSGSSSTNRELCAVLQAMGIIEAIQLDGGPSAGITWQRNLLNPLTGRTYSSLGYGSARHIPYGIAVP